MNYKKLILIFLVFSGLSYYYFHHELDVRFKEKEVKLKEEKVLHLAKDEDVSELSIEFNGKTVSLRKDGDKWEIVAPVKGRANDTAVESVVNTVTIDKKSRSLGDEDVPDESVTGLGNPQVRVTVKIAPSNIKRVLAIGNSSYKSGLYYAKWEDSKEIFLVSENFKNVVSKELDDFRNFYLFYDIDYKNFRRFEISFGGTVFALKKISDTDWRIISGDIDNRADMAALSEYLNKVVRLLVSGFYDTEHFNLKDIGIDGEASSGGYIKLSFNNGIVREVFIGNKIDEKNFYVYRVDDGKILSVASDALSELKKDPASFIDKRVAPYMYRDLKHFEYRKGGRVVSFNLDSDKEKWLVENNDDSKSGDIAKLLNYYFFELKYDYIIDAEKEKELLDKVKKDGKIFALQFYGIEGKESKSFDFYYGENIYIVSDGANYYKLQDEAYGKLNEYLKKIV